MTVTSGGGFARTQVLAPAPGEVIVVEVDRVSVAVANLDDGLAAFDETCTHRECPLSEGSIVSGTVTCPCHKSQFDLRSGEVQNGPATSPIRIRAVRVEDGYLAIER